LGCKKKRGGVGEKIFKGGAYRLHKLSRKKKGKSDWKCWNGI